MIAWHILLAAFTVGLAACIAVLEGLHFFTGRELWFRISSFWTRVFAVSLGMGAVSGIIVPFHHPLWQAASSENTQAFVLIGTLFLLPIILGYTAWSYWVFRGKIRGTSATIDRPATSGSKHG